MSTRTKARNACAAIGIAGFLAIGIDTYLKDKDPCPQYDEMRIADTQALALGRLPLSALNDDDMKKMYRKKSDLEQRVAELRTVPCVEERTGTSPYVAFGSIAIAFGFFGSHWLRERR